MHPVTLPPPSGSSTATGASTVTFPHGLHDATTGQIYAEADGAILRIDLKTRSVNRILAPRLERFRNFVATRRLLVVKQVDDGVGFVISQDDSVRQLPHELSGSGRLYAAGADGIWVVPEGPSGGHRVISQFSMTTDGPKLLGHRSIPEALGIPGSDNAGQLLAQGPAGTYVVTRSSVRRLPGWRSEWELLGIGRTSVLVKTCPRCDATLRNRSSADRRQRATTRGLGAVDKLISIYDYGADGQISPNGRYVAMTIAMNNDQRDLRLAVTDLVTGKTIVIPGLMNRINPNDQFVWLSQTNDRWLLVVADRTLHILDTKTATVHAWRGIAIDRIAVTSS